MRAFLILLALTAASAAVGYIIADVQTKREETARCEARIGCPAPTRPRWLNGCVCVTPLP